MNNFQDIFLYMQDMGVIDVLLPFLLIFTVVFAVLEKAKIFGEKKKNINVMISLIIGLLVVFPHVTGTYPPGGDIVEIMNSAIPNISIIVIAIIMLLILIGIFGKDLTFAGTPLVGVVAILSFLTVAYIFAVAAGWGGISSLDWLKDPQTQATIVVILVFGILIWLITKEPSDPSKKGAVGRLMDSFKDILK